MAFGTETPQADQIRDKWGWFLALGILLLVFGLVAFLNLLAATVASVVYLGVMMLIGGALQFFHAFQAKGWRHSLFWGLSGLLYLLAGLLAFWNPLLTAAAFTLFMAAALVVAGGFRIWVGYRMRPVTGAGWIIFAGIITMLAGIVIAIGWPVNSLWILGLFLAVDLTMQGWALVAVALAARK